MISRIKALIKIKAKSVREFAELIGIKQVTLNQQLVGDRKLSLDVIQSILNSFEDISVEWLLRGEGSMYKSENTTQEAGQMATDENMEATLKQRIRRLLEEKGSSVYQIAKTYNLNQKTLNNQINSETQISASTILHVIEAFPDVSSEWLLLGQGPMYKSENTTQAPSQAEENISGKSTMNVLIKTIEYYQKEVERLVENIDELRNENEILKSELERKHLENERV